MHFSAHLALIKEEWAQSLVLHTDARNCNVKNSSEEGASVEIFISHRAWRFSEKFRVIEFLG